MARQKDASGPERLPAEGLLAPEVRGQAQAIAGLLAGKVRDYFRDPEHRRKFEQWHLETYGEPYVWRPLGGGTHGQ